MAEDLSSPRAMSSDDGVSLSSSSALLRSASSPPSAYSTSGPALKKGYLIKSAARVGAQHIGKLVNYYFELKEDALYYFSSPKV